jgi:hypothetical protein
MNRISSSQWRAAIAATGCATALAFAGCASLPPPTEQIAVSKSAISNAAAAGGAEYAPVEMRSARDKMEGADRAMVKEDYVVARNLAEEAQSDARLAEKKAQSAKAEKAALVTQEDNRVLREEMNRKTK